MKRRAFAAFPVIGLVACVLPRTALSQVIDINDAINKAGRQRMLSQRAAKSYMAMGQKIQGDHADKILAASMALFDRQLAELKGFAPTPEIKNTYASLEASWSDYKVALVGNTAAKAGAEPVLSLAARCFNWPIKALSSLKPLQASQPASWSIFQDGSACSVSVWPRFI